ncbi:MAG: bifunctional riboflavin kinase/FAD synthetase [Elusimicrobia bacterium]|jgi:riboflavin kinase/FMN adenylyltransferase|nr:bifunctional riboflavin kinase/FAD synthetase [Elusimicrobiota bacterium]
MKYAITIGSYDGVHLGHRSILDSLKKYSVAHNTRTAVIYFPIPPKLYLTQSYINNLITTEKERKALITGYGIDFAFPLEFNENIHMMHADDFFNNFILKKYSLEFIAVGRDFSIGYNREGNHEWLQKICKKNKIGCEIVESVKYNEHKISSSLIRTFLHHSRIKEANLCLGENYSITGTVVRGKGMGRKLGFPTANLSVDKHKILPKGVFAAKVLLNNKILNAVVNIGTGPTIRTRDEQTLITEVHILDFNEEIYNSELKVLLIDKIRQEIKFSSTETLISYIKSDINKAREIISVNISS